MNLVKSVLKSNACFEVCHKTHLPYQLNSGHLSVTSSKSHIRTVFGTNASWLRGGFFMKVNMSSKQSVVSSL